MIDNYEVVRETWRQKFLAMDHESLARKFCLKIDAENLYLTYFSHPFAIGRRDGRIIRLDRPEAPSTFNLEMNFFNMFHYAVENPVPSGELVPFRQVKRAYPFEAAYKKGTIQPFERDFAGRVPQLQTALQALKAKPMRQGDAGGILDILPGLRIALTFWDADDEFPAQANLLFDSNITDFMHEENVVMVAGDAMKYIREAAGLDGKDE